MIDLRGTKSAISWPGHYLDTHLPHAKEISWSFNSPILLIMILNLALTHLLLLCERCRLCWFKMNLNVSCSSLVDPSWSLYSQGRYFTWRWLPTVVFQLEDTFTHASWFVNFQPPLRFLRTINGEESYLVQIVLWWPTCSLQMPVTIPHPTSITKIVKAYAGSEILLNLQANMLICHSFMDADKWHETLGE